MVHVVDEGPNYAEETKIPGYVVGGKTGTAQIWDAQSGAWLPDTYNHTFVGFVGNDRPEAMILVRIHDTIPRVHMKWGMSLEVTSNELWRHVAQDAISTLDLAPVPGYDTSQGTDPSPSNVPADPPPPSNVPADAPANMLGSGPTNGAPQAQLAAPAAGAGSGNR
jgi:membrane peptidoglycan carboxypeptidase